MKRLLPAAVLLGAALLSHLAFSPLGFSPTDDGFVLASARRILEGEIPHRDFLFIRPPGSSLLFLPIVAFAGDFTFLAARGFVWLEYALLAGCAVAFAFRASKAPPAMRTAAGLVAFALTAHTFPLMPWYTTDGLVAAVVGLTLALSPRRAVSLSGWALLGAACLFKQSYVFLLPLAIFLLNRKRDAAAWGAGLAPGLLYVASLALLGAWDDALLQLTSQPGAVFVTLLRLLPHRALHLGLLLGMLLDAAARADGPVARRCAGAGFALLVAADLLLLAVDGASDPGSFLLLGVVGGIALHAALGPRPDRDAAIDAFLVACVAAASAVAIGINTPGLAGGLLAALLLRRLDEVGGFSRAVAVALVVLSVVTFVHARRAFLFEERPAAELTTDLGGILPGARGIRTNERTAAYLSDLGEAVRLSRGRPTAILPDAPGWWARAEARNPLPSDWPQAAELRERSLMLRAARALDGLRGRGVVLVAKHRAEALRDGWFPFRENEPFYPLRGWVRATWTKTGETPHFEIYEAAARHVGANGWSAVPPVGWNLHRAAALDTATARAAHEALLPGEIEKATWIEGDGSGWPGEVVVSVLSDTAPRGLPAWAATWRVEDVTGGDLVRHRDTATLGGRDAVRFSIFGFDREVLVFATRLSGGRVLLVEHDGANPNDPSADAHRALLDRFRASMGFE